MSERVCESCHLSITCLNGNYTFDTPIIPAPFKLYEPGVLGRAYNTAICPLCGKPMALRETQY
jgi:predicted RNA-binding Zn-ribbon protein involved in translation (DUF1610 family)